MIRLSAVLALVLLGACNNDKDASGTDVDTDVLDTGLDTDTTVTIPPEPPTWQVTGQVGNILAVHTLAGKGQKENYRVTAVFADALQGFDTAAGCMTRNGLCIQSLPTEDDTFVDTDKDFDEDGRVYTWNGFSVTVDVVDAPFIIEDDGIHYYDFELDGPPLELHPAVSFSGEWGSFSSSSALVIPTLELVEPSASDNVDVTDGFGTVRWTPGGEGVPHLVIVADDFTRVYRLADDGQFEIDWDSLGLGNDIPDVYYARWSVTEHDINGNTLGVVGVTQQAFGVQYCDNFPTTNVPGAKGNGNLGDRPHHLTVGYHGLIYENELHDYTSSGTGVSATIDFVIYDINFQPLCTIQYDASVNTPTTAWTTDNGMALWQGYDIDLSEGKGSSTCGGVDELIFGTRDLREYIEGFTWGFGIGDMSPLQEADLELQFGAQWAIVGPQLHGVYATRDGVTAQEVGFGRNFDLSGCYALETPPVPDELVPTGPDLPNSAYAGFGLYTYDIQP